MSNSGLSPVSGGTGLTGNITPFVYESSLATDLETQLQALIDGIAGGNPAGGLLDICLEGSGDGHAFVVTALVDSAGAALNNGVVYFYEATSEPELQAAMVAALARMQGGTQVTGHAIAGSARGRRWMGVLLVQDVQA